MQYFKVTVNVLDVEEEREGRAWTVDPDGVVGDEADGQELLQFQAGARLTATVTDPDGPDTLTNTTVEVVQVVEQDGDGDGDRHRRSAVD